MHTFCLKPHKQFCNAGKQPINFNYCNKDAEDMSVTESISLLTQVNWKICFEIFV